MQCSKNDATLELRADWATKFLLKIGPSRAGPSSYRARLGRAGLHRPVKIAASERPFSAAGYTVSESHTALSPDTVYNILFLHSNK